MSLISKTVDSPVGKLKLIASEQGLVALLWGEDFPGRVVLGDDVHEGSNALLEAAERELREYFAGQRTVFSVPLDLRGTSFQKAVWEALLTIPFGETRSYAQLARQLGSPNATRAVGAANGKNPVSILVPCHRVVGASGKLTGFAGGLDAKEQLLHLEELATGRCLDLA